ncbi:MAG: hypothetical protein WCW52_09405 [Elusimicrobiales bacterium]
MTRRSYLIALVLAFGGLAACSKQPAPDECKAGITRMMEMQIDALDAPGSATAAIRAELTDEQRKIGVQFLKAQIPSVLKSEFVAQCVSRMKRADLQCTMSATTLDELVRKCHWKVIPGPKGATLGF